MTLSCSICSFFAPPLDNACSVHVTSDVFSTLLFCLTSISRHFKCLRLSVCFLKPGIRDYRAWLLDPAILIAPVFLRFLDIGSQRRLPPPARAVCNRNQSCTTSSFDETFTVSLNIWIGLNRRSSDWNVCKRLLILCITLTDTGVTTRVWDEIVHVTAAEPAPMLKGWNYCRVAPARSRFACRVYFWWKPRVGRCE